MVSQPVLRNGFIWGAHNVGVHTTSGLVAGVRWFQLEARDPSPVIRFDQDAVFASEGSWNFDPALSVDDNGNVGMVFTRSGNDEYGSCYYTGRLATDPPNTTRPAALLQAGRSEWVGDRWGYYQGIASDPVDESIWMLGAYVNAPDRWATWVGQLSLNGRAI
jgi:hypothetical protein